MASIGAVDPWSAGIMGAASVAGKSLDKGSSYNAAAFSDSFDSSGWNINIGSGAPVQANTNSHTPTATTAGAVKSALSNPMILIVVGLVIYLKMHK
jgi:hypothetical protein